MNFPLLCLFLLRILELPGDPTVIVRQTEVFGESPGVWFLSIRGLAPLAEGGVIVADKLDYRLKRLSPAGRVVLTVGGRGKGPGQFLGPGPVDAWNDLIAAADFASDRVQIFARDFTYRGGFSAPGPVSDLCFDSGGGLWVAPITGDRNMSLVRCDMRGNITRRIALRNARGHFIYDVTSLAATRRGELVVTFLARNKVELWDTSGTCKGEFSVPGLCSAPPTLSLRGMEAPDGVPRGNLFWGATVDRRDNIYILGGDYSERPGQILYVLGKKGKMMRRIMLPVSAVQTRFGPDGSLFLVPADRSRVIRCEIVNRRRK